MSKKTLALLFGIGALALTLIANFCGAEIPTEGIVGGVGLSAGLAAIVKKFVEMVKEVK